MLINVFSKKDIKSVDGYVRSEDIKEVYEDPYDDSQCVLEFYDNRESLTIEESLPDFMKRFLTMELKHYYNDKSFSEDTK